MFLSRTAADFLLSPSRSLFLYCSCCHSTEVFGSIGRFFFFLNLRGRERERGRETDIDPSLLIHAPTKDRTCDLRLCPNGALNLWPLGLWDDTPVNWATPARAGRFLQMPLFYPFSFQWVITSPLGCFIWKKTLSAHPLYHPYYKVCKCVGLPFDIPSNTCRLIFCFENKRYGMRWGYREILCIAEPGSSHIM